MPHSKSHCAWHLLSTREGVYGQPRRLTWPDYRRLVKDRRVEESYDGNWAELYDEDGLQAAVLIRLGDPVAV